MTRRTAGQGGDGGAESASVDQDKKAVCIIDVAANYALGFLPGYNALKLGLSMTGTQINFGQFLTGNGSLISGPSNIPDFAAAAASTVYGVKTLQFATAGGNAALGRASDLVNRIGFAAKSAASQEKLLGTFSQLSNLSKAVSVAGTVSNVLNTVSAAYDAYQCIEGK